MHKQASLNFHARRTQLQAQVKQNIGMRKYLIYEWQVSNITWLIFNSFHGQSDNNQSTSSYRYSCSRAGRALARCPEQRAFDRISESVRAPKYIRFKTTPTIEEKKEKLIFTVLSFRTCQGILLLVKRPLIHKNTGWSLPVQLWLTDVSRVHATSLLHAWTGVTPEVELII